MHIKCTNGTPTVDMLDHLPPLPLFINYRSIPRLTEQDVLGIYHALRLHDRVYHVDLEPQPSILQKVFVLMGGYFPILEYLSFTFSATSKYDLPLILPKAFLAPNLHHLALPHISPSRRLRVLTSTDSLVKLELSKIQTSSYFRPRLLVARLSSLPRLEELSIGFSIPIPRPSAERELLGEQGTPLTLPSLTDLWFKGTGAYLESLVAQIRAPRLERLRVTLFNQIAFALPHLFHFINTIEEFKPRAMVSFDCKGVSITMAHSFSTCSMELFRLRVICKPFDWQIDCAAQFCNALMPTLSGVKQVTLECSYNFQIPTALEDGAIEWHELLRSLIGVKELDVYKVFLKGLSRTLQEDEVGLDPGFLPNLRSIRAKDNMFTSFINTRQVVGRPVEFVDWY